MISAVWGNLGIIFIVVAKKDYLPQIETKSMAMSMSHSYSPPPSMPASSKDTIEQLKYRRKEKY